MKPSEISEALNRYLHPVTKPVAITFHSSVPSSPRAHAGRKPEPTEDGRTGTVSAGCVFWVDGAVNSFTTTPADHRNCSVGSYTHGMISAEAAATSADIATVLEVGWITPQQFSDVPAIAISPAAVTYGPLCEQTQIPDVVLLRLSPHGVMLIGDACPGLQIEGKPQCHIVAIAHNDQRPAASVGCALSRARTGMTVNEMTVALPGPQLDSIITALDYAHIAAANVAKYAASDAQRFH
jgi:uncharacterized protein (DUF169 family)